jgi:hypothetical protein
MVGTVACGAFIGEAVEVWESNGGGKVAEQFAHSDVIFNVLALRFGFSGFKRKNLNIDELIVVGDEDFSAVEHRDHVMEIFELQPFVLCSLEAS